MQRNQIRTQMPRQSRKKSSTGIYHVMLRGINKQDIFEEEEDYVRMKEILIRLNERRDEQGHPLPQAYSMYAYCLMSNHIHLLIRERNEGIAETMKRLGIGYAAYFNKKYQRSGHLFQDRFRSEPVESMEYFIILLRYIHQNPVKAAIVKDVGDYPWSSWREYTDVPVLCDTRTVLNRSSLEDLTALVNEPVADDGNILEIDTADGMMVTDEDIRTFLFQTYNIHNPLEMQNMNKEFRNAIIKAAKEYGGSIRQLSRLTGVKFADYEQIKSAHRNRPHELVTHIAGSVSHKRQRANLSTQEHTTVRVCPTTEGDAG